MPKDERKNNLAPKRNPVNALGDAVFGDQDQYRAYLSLYGLDDSTMTERTLSPESQAYLREMGEVNLNPAKKYKYPPGFKSELADEPTEHPQSQAMYEVLGNVAANNVRAVTIDGVPYYQILDYYDFDLGADNIKKEGWGPTLTGAFNGVYRRHLAENVAGGLGLARNLNYLVPVDPNRTASPEAVDAFRKKTDLKYPSQTLGTKVINHLRDAATPKYTEKAMP